MPPLRRSQVPIGYPAAAPGHFEGRVAEQGLDVEMQGSLTAGRRRPNGAGERNRTPNQLITIQPLYR